MKLGFFVFCLLSVFLKSAETCELNESCPASNGQSGIVKVGRHCEVFMSLSRKDKRSFGRCGFLGKSTLVCCPIPIELRVQSRFTRKAVDQCKKFAQKPAVDDIDEINTRIYNGDKSDVGEFPHFSQIGQNQI